jgi:diguanylate cyclase (GGDEF)-like protein
MGRLLDNRQSIEEGPHIWRASDVTARYGGEEFAVLLPDTSVEGAVAFAERLRRRVMALTRSPELANLATLSFPLSCSIGVAMFPTDSTTPTELVMAADAAVYGAKDAGKNCVNVFEREKHVHWNSDSR